MTNPPEENMGMWSYLRQVDNKKTDWALRMRAVRVYHVPQRNGTVNSMDIIFHNKEVKKSYYQLSVFIIFLTKNCFICYQGTQIHVKVNSPEFKLYKSKIKEDGVYALHHFCVQPNSSTYKTTSHSWLLIVTRKTWFRDLTPKDENLVPQERRFPRFTYNFRSFASIHADVDIDQTMTMGNLFNKQFFYSFQNSH